MCSELDATPIVLKLNTTELNLIHLLNLIVYFCQSRIINKALNFFLCSGVQVHNFYLLYNLKYIFVFFLTSTFGFGCASICGNVGANIYSHFALKVVTQRMIFFLFCFL